MKKTWLKLHEKGSLILLYVQPGASTSEIVGTHGERLKIKIKAPPRDGEANEAIIEFFAEKLKIPKKKIYLIRGESSRQKDLLVELSLEIMISVFSKQ